MQGIGLPSCVAVMAILIGSSSLAQDKGHGVHDHQAPNITAQMCVDDKRLNQNITFGSRRTSVGELLEQLTAKYHVELSTGTRDGAADVAVAFHCRETPLYKMLNGLWSAMSYHTGIWEWERYGETGKFSYRMTQPSGARRLRERLREWMQQRLEANAALVLATVDGSDEDKKKILRQIYGTDDIEKMCAFSPEMMWDDAKAIKELLTPAQQSDLLRGNSTFNMPFSSLSGPLQESVLARWKETNKDSHYIKTLPDGSQIESPLPAPQSVQFERAQYGSTQTIQVFVPPGFSPHLFGGIPLEAAYRQYLHKLWKLEGESASDPAEMRFMAKPRGGETELPSPHTLEQILGLSGALDRPLTADEQAILRKKLKLLADTEALIQQIDRRFEQVAAGAEVPLIARLPEVDRGTTLSVPWEQTLREYWNQLWNKPLMVKWHDGVQIVSTESWPVEDPALPLWLIRTLRKHSKPGELLPFDDLTTCAANLTRGQLLRIQREFPVMEAVAVAQGLLAMFQKNPVLIRQALTETGLPLTPPVIEAMRESFPKSLLEVIDKGEARFLTVRIYNNDAPGAKSRDVQFQLRSREGKLLRGMNFTETPQPPLIEEENAPK